ncbi:MAG: hypothetical protein ACRD2B_03975 [Terriglobia bacterium]
MLRDLQWSPSEKKAARKAFEAAYERECGAIASRLKEMMQDDADPRYIWRIHEYLSQQRRDTDQKYDYRYSVLIEVFARLLNEGWLKEQELSGLSPDKIEQIKGLADFFAGRA